jgi:hypothetical protein
MDFTLELIKQMGNFGEAGFVSYKVYRDVHFKCVWGFKQR